ncbi:MAG: hypothetical protein QF721_06765 [Verrucomicrobiota bacterium]|nr:hypothetical protein [Verrucomicrobiota bacterium]
MTNATAEGINHDDKGFLFKDIYLDPQTLQFEGQQFFTGEQIKKGLGNSVQYWAAAYRNAPVQDFPVVVRKLVRAGYLHAGFPDAEVSILGKTKKGIYRVKIKEGKRYTCGNIIIAPNDTFSSYDELRRIIVSPPDGNEPHYIPVEWKKDQPAPMDEALNPISYEQNINTFLANLGSNLKGNITITRQPNRQVADMHVSFKQVENTQTISEIDVDGSEKNSKDDVLDYLQIKPGMIYDDGLEARLEEKLRQSARFLSHEIWFENAENGSTKKMNIKLSDYNKSPPLSYILPEEDEIVVNFFNYLQNWNAWDRDIVIKLNTNSLDHKTLQYLKEHLEPLLSPSLEMPEARIILSNEGLLFSFRELKRNGSSDLIAAMGYSSNAGFGFFLPALQKKYCAESKDIPNSTGGFSITASMLPIPKPGKDGKNIQFLLGAGFSTIHKKLLSVNIAPVASIALLRGKDTQTEIKDGYLAIKKSNEAMSLMVKLDLNTNTLISVEVHDLITSRLILEASMQSDALEESMNKIFSETNSFPNNYDSANRFGSLLALVVEWISPAVFSLKDQPSDLARQTEILAGLVSKTGLLAERIWGLEEGNSFDLGRFDWSKVILEKGKEVPVRSLGQKNSQKIRDLINTADPRDQSSAQTTSNSFFYHAMAMLLFEIKDDLFPRGSWPWIMIIESMLIHERELIYSEEFLVELCKSSKIGPIGCAIASHLLETSGSKRVMDCALKGLGRLSAQEFEKDYRPILDPGSALDDVFSEVSQFYTQLSSEEKTLLQNAIETLPSISEVVQKLDGYPDKPASKILRPEMDNLWNRTVKQMAKDYLQSRVFGKTSSKIYTDLPGIDLSGLTASEKNAVLMQARREKCPCGCKLTIAVCRNEDSSCKTSVGIAEKIVERIAGAK